MRGTDLLREEHQVIAKSIQLLDAICDGIEKGIKVPPSLHLRQITEFMSQYVEVYHHSREEDVLIPLLSSLTWPERDQTIKDILDQHALNKAYILALGQSIANSAAMNKFVGHARNLIGFLSEHILKEETFLFREAERILSVSQQEELGYQLSTPETVADKKKHQELCKAIDQLGEIYLAPKAAQTTCCGCGGHG